MRKLGIANPTLRDCFDPNSSEYDGTTIEQKIATLRKVILNGYSLLDITTAYKDYYIELKKAYVGKDLHFGLKRLINYFLAKHTLFELTYSSEYTDEELAAVLLLFLRDENYYPTEAKKIFYRHLVNKRKKHSFNDPGLLNPSQISNGIYDVEQLSPWATWHGNLDAKFLVIGQDFSNIDYYQKNKGKDSIDNPTNANLGLLFNEIGIKLGTIDNPNDRESVYLTNAVLGIKNGGMASSIKRSWYVDTAKKFIKPLIEIINPEIIITMGKAAYETIATIYDLEMKPLKLVIETTSIPLPNNVKLFPVYHCSGLGLANRSWDKQLEDWRKIKSAL